MRVGNQIVRWPFMLAFAGPLLLVLLRASPLGPNLNYAMIGIPALLVLWGLAALVAGVIVLIALVRRRWSYALVTSIVPVAVIVAALQPFAFLHLTNRLGDAIHFALMRSSYVAKVESLPATGKRFVVFNRGGMVWASNGVVYDESDEVALPPKQQSNAGRRRVIRSELGCGAYAIQKIDAHFYVADFSC